jgi:hypothetical protein
MWDQHVLESFRQLLISLPEEVLIHTPSSYSKPQVLELFDEMKRGGSYDLNDLGMFLKKLNVRAPLVWSSVSIPFEEISKYRSNNNFCQPVLSWRVHFKC